MTRRKIVLGKTTEGGVSIARNKATGGNFVRATLQIIEGQEVPYFKAHDGENCIRILPPTEDQNFWGTQIFVHYSVGVDNSDFMCRKKMKIGGGDCPICEQRAIVASEQQPKNEKEEKALKDLLYELKPKERWLLQIIDRDEQAKGTQVWNAPTTLVNEILKQTQIPSRLGGGTKPIDDVELGSDIMFYKGMGKSGFIEYSGVQVLDVDSEITESNILEMFYLVDLFAEPSYDDVSLAFGGITKDDSLESEDVVYQEEPEEDVDEVEIERVSRGSGSKRQVLEPEPVSRVSNDPVIEKESFDEVIDPVVESEEPVSVGNRVRRRVKEGLEPPTNQATSRGTRRRVRAS